MYWPGISQNNVSLPGDYETNVIIKLQRHGIKLKQDYKLIHDRKYSKSIICGQTETNSTFSILYIVVIVVIIRIMCPVNWHQADSRVNTCKLYIQKYSKYSKIYKKQAFKRS